MDFNCGGGRLHGTASSGNAAAAQRVTASIFTSLAVQQTGHSSTAAITSSLNDRLYTKKKKKTLLPGLLAQTLPHHGQMIITRVSSSSGYELTGANNALARDDSTSSMAITITVVTALVTTKMAV